MLLTSHCIEGSEDSHLQADFLEEALNMASPLEMIEFVTAQSKIDKVHARFAAAAGEASSLPEVEMCVEPN